MRAVSSTFKKLAVLLAAFTAGDLIALYRAKMDHLPAHKMTFRPTYRAVAVISTAFIIFRKNPSSRLVLWPAAGFIIQPRLMDAFDGPGNPAERLDSEVFGAKAGFTLAILSLKPWQKLRGRR